MVENRPKKIALDSKVRLDVHGPCGPVMLVEDIYEDKALCSHYDRTGTKLFLWLFLSGLVLDEDCEEDNGKGSR